jgi:hypothetical protein
MGFLRRLFFGSGRLPKMVRGQIESEDVLLLEEGLLGSITYRRYRAPGKRARLKKVGIAGAVCVTDRRLLVWGARGKLIDVPFDDERFAAIEVAAEEPDRVLFAWENSVFHSKRSGRVEVRLHPLGANQVLVLLQR